ncbi:MAG: ABC transporter substrate binding protein [Thiohalobacteraceae bacterium]
MTTRPAGWPARPGAFVTRIRKWSRLLALGLGGCLWAAAHDLPAAAAEEGPPPRIAVVYPDIGEPYSSIFVSITQGIQAELGESPTVIRLGPRAADAARARLEQERIEVCITLGRTALDAVEGMGLNVAIVRGAVLDPDVRTGAAGEGGLPPVGISLVPDPALLLVQLRRLAPHVSRVTVVYSDSQGQPVIDRAVEVGQRLGLTVMARKVEDLQSAAASYKSVVATLGPSDALWIPQDPQAVDDRVILPMLLNAAWEQDFVLFSSNADHAKRGVLYSVYPNNVDMGRRLARVARQRATAPAAVGLLPLEDLLMAVNLRTAEHLRLNLSPDLIRSFDLVFPQR